MRKVTTIQMQIKLNKFYLYSTFLNGHFLKAETQSFVLIPLLYKMLPFNMITVQIAKYSLIYTCDKIITCTHVVI